MPDQPGVMVTNVKPGQDSSASRASRARASFRPKASRERSQRAEAMRVAAEPWGGSQAAAANDTSPGGGLGAPIDAPDPLHDYRAYILGAFALLGGYGRIRRLQVEHVSSPGRSLRLRRGCRGRGLVDNGEAAADFADDLEPTAPARDRNALLLEAMKEELFQLEIDRQQGKVSPEEYAKAKAALDETIKRALARSTKI